MPFAKSYCFVLQKKLRKEACSVHLPWRAAFRKHFFLIAIVIIAPLFLAVHLHGTGPCPEVLTNPGILMLGRQQTGRREMLGVAGKQRCDCNHVRSPVIYSSKGTRNAGTVSKAFWKRWTEII